MPPPKYPRGVRVRAAVVVDARPPLPPSTPVGFYSADLTVPPHRLPFRARTHQSRQSASSKPLYFQNLVRAAASSVKCYTSGRGGCGGGGGRRRCGWARAARKQQNHIRRTPTRTLPVPMRLLPAKECRGQRQRRPSSSAPLQRLY